jgi:hypothetical protein
VPECAALEEVREMKNKSSRPSLDYLPGPG